MTKILKYVLYAILLLNFTPVASLLFTDVMHKGTYIHSISADKDSRDFINKSLDTFNKIGYGGVVKRIGYRPVFIRTANLRDDTLGIAFPFPLFGVILLNEKLKPGRKLQMTIYHEMAHIMFPQYGHSKDPRDLMYPIITKHITLRSVRNWALKIKEIQQ